jgi:hypothetical protein
MDNPGDPSNWYTDNQASTGSFIVGESTKITITVRNNGDDTITDIPVNLSITDFIHNQPMRRSPDSKYIESLSADQTAEVIFDWTPPYASTSVRITAEVEMFGDTDSSNNALSWSGIKVCKWWDDLEGTTGGWSHTERDDLVPGSSDDWHLTTTAFAQNSDTHTSTHSWYEGNSDGTGAVHPVDSYRNNNAQSLISPTIDLGSNVDTRLWYIYLGTYTSGDYEGYQAFQYHLTSVNWLMTGVTEENDQAQNMSEYRETSDVLLAGDISDDGGSSWNRYFTGVSGGRRGELGQVLWYSTSYTSVNHNAQQVYFYSGIPFNYNVTSWNNVRFRHTFKADNDSVEDIGYYLDDFIIYGNDNYTVKDRVSITDISYPKTSGVPIIYMNSAVDFKVKVKNFGGAQNSVPVKMWVVDEYGNTVSGSTKQVMITSLETGGESEVPLSWTPEQSGDFKLWIEAGDQSQDWTPSDNKESIYLHVGTEAAADIDILVVDDDNSGGQLGLWRMDTEDRMLRALDDIELEYRVFTVEDNKTGPSSEIMGDYELVIWITGLDNANWSNNNKWPVTLKDDDISELGDYMNSGGKLWLISPGYIWERHGREYKTITPSDFSREYLKIMSCQGMLTEYVDGQLNIRGTPEYLNGSDESLMKNVEYDTYVEEPPWGFADIGGAIDKKDPGDDDTSRLFYQDDARLNFNSLFYKGQDYMAATFAFNFYIIPDREDREDCVWKILTGFEMTGGVTIELFKPSEAIKTSSPGQKISYQLKITNPGKKSDTMELSVRTEYSKDYPNKYRFWDPMFEGDDVVIKGQKYTVTIDGLKSKNKIYLKVTAPTTDDYSEYPSPIDWMKFKITARSRNTFLENETSCIAKVPILGNVTIDCDDTTESIKVNDYAEFRFELYNETNDNYDVDVELSYSGPGQELASFYVDGDPVANNKITATLEANEINSDIELRVTAGEHTLSGYHNVTVALKDQSDSEVIDTIEFSTFVEQFYSVDCYTTGDENGDINFTIDPNQYRNEVDDYIIKTFPVNVRNFGNGEDEVTLSWDEGDGSDDTSLWLEPRIYEALNGDLTNVSEVKVEPHDESKTNERYAEETVNFDILIPLDIKIGEYIIDFIITSSGNEIGGTSAESDNSISFSFEIIKPNLVFTKLDSNGNSNFEFYNTYDDILIEEDPEIGDYYVEKPEADFDNLEIEISVMILNDDISEIELEPEALWLNITHIDENGDKVHDQNISQTISPTSATPIGSTQKVTFKFRWDPDTEPSDEPVEYTLKLTVDPKNEIFETNEDDNTAEFQITIKNIKKHDEVIDDDSTMLILILVMIAVVAVILIVFFLMKKKPVIEKDEKKFEEIVEAEEIEENR